MSSPTNGNEETGDSAEGGSRRLHKASTSGMESSILRYKDLNFVVGKGEKQKNILTDVSGKVKWGRVIAVMGPSGAGKTTLINLLTLDAYYGKAYGSVTLNGVPMTDDIFQEHCYVVVQHDKHWPYLSCRETLRYSAELYDVAAPEDLDAVVQEIIVKMGLESCADTRNSSLSGGQRRRLSIGIALLKQPTLLFLDEPTSGLDAAAASNIMQEIVRVAKDERLIIFCTIHQPSTKVYNSFDQLMIMSRGREAYSGDVRDAIEYFESIGYPCPPATNPAEFFLDLVNSDFSDEAEITQMLDTWEEKRPSAGSSHHKKGFGDDDDDAQEGVVHNKRAPLRQELVIMFRRHFAMIIRDPVLYIGRCFVFFIANLVFTFVYWNARDYTQDQAINKFWVHIWFVCVPANMGVVAVYALNDEFKTIMREAKNGMVRTSGISYVLAKSILVLPIFFIFALFALGIPAFAIQDIPGEAFGILVIMFAVYLFVYESLAECLSVWFEDPIIGMLQFMNFWFASFLFAGFLIPKEDLYYPFELFYYLMPFSYYSRSYAYELFSVTTFESCDRSTSLSSVCTEETDGLAVLGQLSQIFTVLSTKSYTGQDIVILVCIGVFYKLMYIMGVWYKLSRTIKIHSTAEYYSEVASKVPLPEDKPKEEVRKVPISEPDAKAVAPDSPGGVSAVPSDLSEAMA